MRIIGHGLDLVELDRIRRMLDDHHDRFVERCFTASEQAFAERRPGRRAECYGARFAAKEAVLKALGTGLGEGITWTDIEITRAGNGRPGIRLSGRAAEIARSAGIDAWHVSLSHTESAAVASVIACGS